MDYIFPLLNAGVSVASIYLLYQIHQTQAKISTVLENCQNKTREPKDIQLNISKIECNSMEIDQASINRMQNDTSTSSFPGTPRSEDGTSPFKLTDSISRKSINRYPSTHKSFQLPEIPLEPTSETPRTRTRSKSKTSSFIDMIKK